MTQPQDFPLEQVKVRQMDMGGWLRIFAEPQEGRVADLPIYLSYAATQWFRARPQYRLLSLLPVSKGGDTVELHVWYEQHLFPEVSGLQSLPAQERQT